MCFTMEAEKIFEVLFASLPEGTGDKCPDLETICAYSDNSLTLNSRKPLEEHLLNCSKCFDHYIHLCKEREEHREMITTPQWIRNRVIGKNNSSFLNPLIERLFRSWSWLSWGNGFAVGIGVTIIIFMCLSLIFQNFHPLPSINLNPVSHTPTPPINYIIPTGGSDLSTAANHYKKGEQYLSTDLLKAKEEFIEAVKYNPDYAEAHWQLGTIYEKEGDYKEALKHWKRYMCLVPEVGSYEEVKSHIENLKAFEK